MSIMNDDFEKLAKDMIRQLELLDNEVLRPSKKMEKIEELRIRASGRVGMIEAKLVTNQASA